MNLYLIPCNLSSSSLSEVIPDYVLKDIIPNLSFFMVENLRTARRFLKKVDTGIDIDNLTFCEIGKSSNIIDTQIFFHEHIKNADIGILSEAGCPGVADPGSEIVALAHTVRGVNVIPLAGPSSILLALMGAGFNGQSFTFHGYIPVQKNLRSKKLKQMETNARKWKQTQIFIETPFRNNQMYESILVSCQSNTRLCIASNLTAVDEYIKTKTIREWQQEENIDLHKKPTVFLIF